MLKPPRELEALWYQTLKEQGFEDIEEQGQGGPRLKTWHSWDLPKERNHEHRQRGQEYQVRIDSFLHRPDFDAYCVLAIKHGNAEITATQVRIAWVLHCEGMTERKIAGEISRSKTGVHKLLERLRTWMKLV